MSKEEILEQIEIVLPKLKQWMQYKNASLEQGDRIIIANVLKEILPNKKVNFSCSGCVGELLTTVYSYYQREKATE